MTASRLLRAAGARCWPAASAVAFSLLVASIPAQAQSSRLPAAFTKEVTAACTKASDLHRPKAAGQVIDFEDQIGMAALVVEGDVMLSRTKSRKGRVLCLFDKVTRNAFIGDATGLISTRR